MITLIKKGTNIALQFHNTKSMISYLEAKLGNVALEQIDSYTYYIEANLFEKLV